MADTAAELPDDIEALRALVLAQRAELALARSGLMEQRYEIEALEARLARLLRATFTAETARPQRAYAKLIVNTIPRRGP